MFNRWFKLGYTVISIIYGTVYWLALSQAMNTILWYFIGGPMAMIVGFTWPLWLVIGIIKAMFFS